MLARVKDPRTAPTGIRAPHGADITHIDWADGHEGVYPNDVLRGFCPCAKCQGHGGNITFQPGGSSELRDLETVGTYALKLVWGDGHDTGIYTFQYLRDLCRCYTCRVDKPDPTVTEDD